VGDGYLIIGDAARFVDPILSSGISVALNSGKFASEVIVEALKANDFREEVFKPYELRLRKGVEIWYEFIRLYYKLLPLFTYFVQTPKYRLQIFRLLQGEVYDRSEVPVLQAMRDYIEKVEQNENHVFRRALTNIPLGDLEFAPDFIAELESVGVEVTAVDNPSPLS
jgi:FADH2 O2-dependent halogenase